MNIKFSMFLEEKEINEMVAVFHRLHPTPLYFDKKEWGLRKKGLICFDESTEDLLMKEGLVIGSDNEDVIGLERVRSRYEKSLDQVRTLYLVLTHKCNLVCKYCFISRSFCDRTTLMNSDTARKGIDLWLRHIDKNSERGLKYFIIFYGGEPLLNLVTLENALEYIEGLRRRRKIPNNTQTVVFTNGLLLDSVVVKMLKKYTVSVTVSLDGPERFHDKYRLGKEGKGTFKKSIGAIKILKDVGIEVWVSATITPSDLGFSKEFVDIIEGLKLSNFGLNRLAGNSLFYLDANSVLEQYDQRAADEVMQRFILAGKAGISEERTQDKVEAFSSKNFCLLDCNGYGEQTVVQPNGWVSNCHASSQYDIMHIDEWPRDLLIKDVSCIKNWRRRLPLYNEECLGCQVLSICGGGCPWSTAEKTGNLFNKDEAFCVYTKKVFDFIIEEDYKKNKIK